MYEATSLTLLVSIIASILVLFVSPVYGLIVYLASFVYYPSYLSAPLGTVNFTVTRIVILVILAKLFLQTGLPGRFRFIWLDKLVLVYFAAQILVGATTAESLEVFLQNRAGAVFDMVLPYFAVRIIITDKSQYLSLLKGILVSAAPLAIFGLYQCLTGRNILDFIPGQRTLESLPVRHGLYRASLTFSVSIMFGLYFAMFVPLCVGLLRNYTGRNKRLYMFCVCLMGVGVFSSMSSGPLLAAILSLFFIGAYRYRRYWKPFLIVIIVMCGVVEIISNRHFYDVLGDFTLSPETSWYRSKLIDVALFRGGMSGHWLAGFGESVDPGWASKIDQRDHTDIVNQYLLVLSSYGLVGLISFIAMIIAALKIMFDILRTAKAESDMWLTWCLLGDLVGLLCTFVSVSLFGPPTTVFFMILGFVGSLPLITYRNNLSGKLTKAFRLCNIEKPQIVYIPH
jgi:hypothetical protein